MALEILTPPGVDPRLILLRAGAEVDAVLVLAARMAVLVDTLPTPALCAEALARLAPRIGGRPLYVVNSHMDWDHFWGNAAVAGRAPILAQRAALPRYHDPAMPALLARKAAEETRFAGLALHPPDITFEGELALQGGDLTLQLLHTPGHTPDHLSVWIPEIATCLAVDAAEWPVPEVWSDDPADLAALRGSLARLRALGARCVLPAHGQTTSPALLDGNIAYFDALERRLRAGGPEPALAELVPEAAALPPDQAEFYRGCHASNLRAQRRACAGG